MHLFDGDAVDFGFGFAQPLKNSRGIAPGALRQPGGVDDLQNMGKVAVAALRLHRNVELGGGNGAAPHFFKRNRSADSQGTDGADDGVRIRAAIGEGSDQHVAADA